MKCPECDNEMTDKQTIAALKKRVEQLEMELMFEKFKPVPYVPYVPYTPPQPWETWCGDGTEIGIASKHASIQA